MPKNCPNNSRIAVRIGSEYARKVQAKPDQHRDLIVRVAGYSDYFCDLSEDLQQEIISRTEHQGF